MSVSTQLRTADTAARASRQKLTARMLSPTVIVVLNGLVIWLYAWFATAGTWKFATASVPYYDLLADAFLDGQLHLKASPSPELLALADPYDPEQHGPYRLPDASLYNGKYYLYFAPVPGLLHAGWKLVTGHRAEENAMMLLFGLGSCFWFWLLASELRNRVFPQVPMGAVHLVYMCYALGGVSLYLQARTIGHHEAILAAGFFTLAGTYWWFRALNDGPGSVWQLILAGFLFGCGFGSRMTTFGYAVGAGLVLAWPCLMGPGRRTAFWRAVAFSVIPATMLAAILLYNYARFGSFTEFGLKYALTGIKGQDLQGTTLGLLDLPMVSINMLTYLFYVPRFIPYFPFMVPAPWPTAGRWVLEQPFISVLLVAPLTLFAPIAGLLVFRLRGRSIAATRAFIVGSGIGVLITIGTVLTVIWATGRYMHDFLPLTCILGGLAFWWLWSATGTMRTRLLARGALCAVLSISVPMGVLYGWRELSISQPPIYARLTYAADRAVAGFVMWISPTSWPGTYLADEVRQRDPGVFYPEQSTISVRVPPGSEPVRSLEVESLFPSVVRVLVEIDGESAGEEFARPGRQMLRVSESVVSQLQGRAYRADVRLQFPDEAPQPASHLWPFRVGDLSIRAPDQSPSVSRPARQPERLSNLRVEAERARAEAERAREAAERAQAEERKAAREAAESRTRLASLNAELDRDEQAGRAQPASDSARLDAVRMAIRDEEGRLRKLEATAERQLKTARERVAAFKNAEAAMHDADIVLRREQAP